MFDIYIPPDVRLFQLHCRAANVLLMLRARKQQVTSGQTELEALEARIKEMEERLKKQQPAGGLSPRAQRQAIGDAFAKKTALEKDIAAQQQQQLQRPYRSKIIPNELTRVVV